MAFKLYDTFGFPIELTEEAASEAGKTVDLDGFKEELRKQKELARASRSDEQSMNTQNEDMLNFKEPCEFVGYDSLECKAHVTGIFKDGELASFGKGKLILAFDKTPFYATMGGQIGDKGKVIIKGKEFDVLDSMKLPNGEHAVLIDSDQEIKLEDEVELVVNKEERAKTCANHSGTHLLNEALRKVLGNHVSQHGSSVESSGLRFDFNNFYLPTGDELLNIEKLVNEEIEKNSDTNTVELPLEVAKRQGVQAVFGEKYGDVVRVVTIGFSKELCGGTHVSNTRDIKKLAILSCESKGSGIFRITAVTGNDVKKLVLKELEPVTKEIKELKDKINELVNDGKKEGINLSFNQIPEKEIEGTYASILEKKEELALVRNLLKDLDKEYNKLKKEKNNVSMDDFLKEVVECNGVKVLVFRTNDLEVDNVKDLVDRLSDYLGNSVVFAGNVKDGKIIFVCKNKVASLNAGMLVKEAATITLGGGGGRPDFAQAGGRDVTKLDQALDTILNKIKASL